MLFYMYALKRFGKQLWKEPNTVMCASILMTLLGLPVLTIGIALCAGVAYMYAKEKGIETSFRMALREIRPCAGKALGMGIVDLACIVAVVSCIARLLDKSQLALGLGSAVLLYLLLFYLSTAMFRYPVLTLNPHLSLGQVVLCAMSMTLKNMGWMFLYWCVVLLALLICGATGVGMVLLLPGCTALMMTTAWSESLKKEEYRQQQNAA